MLFRVMENISNDDVCLDVELLPQRTKSLDKFLEELKKSANTDAQVYIRKTTWAKELRIDRKTLSTYIDQFIDSDHFIEIPYDDERYDKAKGKLLCLKIVNEPFSYKEELIAYLKESIKNFKPKK